MSDMDVSDVPIHPVLQDVLSETIKQQIIKVCDGVHVAVGYSMANSIMLEGPDGLIIVDVSDHPDNMATILTEFRKITKKPVQAIIYTHSHRDHTLGGVGLQQYEGYTPPEIWANIEWKNNSKSVWQSLAEASIFPRFIRQFGVALGAPSVGAKGGVGLNHKPTKAVPLQPNRFLDKQVMETTIAGLSVTLLQTPSESPDHMAIWIPEWKVLCCGDIVYRSLPNVYPLRGATNRSAMEWVAAIDALNGLGAHYLVTGHTLPIVGKDHITSTLAEYRDGLQYIHDQTIRQMNLHIPPDQIAPNMTLPQSLQNNRMLIEGYGRIDWISRHTMCQQTGWFSGDVLQLAPLTNDEKAERMVKAMGGVSKLLDAADDALENNDPRWALELSSYAIQSKEGSHEKARALNNRALKVLAGQQVNWTARNYYLTWLLEENKVINTKLPVQVQLSRWQILSIDQIFEKMAVRLNPEACQGVFLKAAFAFTDTMGDFILTIRNCIMQIERNPCTAFDFKVTTTTTCMIGIICQQRPLSETVSCGDVMVDGNTAAVKQFFSFFDDFAEDPDLK